MAFVASYCHHASFSIQFRLVRIGSSNLTFRKISFGYRGWRNLSNDRPYSQQT